jgi:uncharacterized membrane protein
MTLGFGVIAIGVIVVVVSVLADPIGIGSEDTFGWRQIVGVIVGAGIAAIGIAMAWRAENPRPDFPAEE